MVTGAENPTRSSASRSILACSSTGSSPGSGRSRSDWGDAGADPAPTARVQVKSRSPAASGDSLVGDDERDVDVAARSVGESPLVLSGSGMARRGVVVHVGQRDLE